MNPEYAAFLATKSIRAKIAFRAMGDAISRVLTFHNMRLEMQTVPVASRDRCSKATVALTTLCRGTSERWPHAQKT
jgi:hypothetical protein